MACETPGAIPAAYGGGTGPHWRAVKRKSQVRLHMPHLFLQKEERCSLIKNIHAVLGKADVWYSQAAGQARGQRKAVVFGYAAGFRKQ